MVSETEAMTLSKEIEAQSLKEKESLNFIQKVRQTQKSLLSKTPTLPQLSAIYHLIIN